MPAAFPTKRRRSCGFAPEAKAAQKDFHPKQPLSRSGKGAACLMWNERTAFSAAHEERNRRDAGCTPGKMLSSCDFVPKAKAAQKDFHPQGRDLKEMEEL